MRATRGSRLPAPLFGLAPGGVYPAADVTTSAVRSYRTFSPLPTAAPSPSGAKNTAPSGELRQDSVAVCFLWHWPWARAPQELPGTLPGGARTFLHVPQDAATVQPTP